MPEIETITPGLAAKWLAATAESEDVRYRNSHMNRVLNYATEIRAGHWVEDGGSSIVLGPNGEIIDGVHRLKAIILSDKSIRVAVTHLDSLDDAAAALGVQGEQD